MNLLTLIEQIAKNMNMLEQLAVAIFRLVSAEVNGTVTGYKSKSLYDQSG